MYLKSLEISGFKSFAKKATLYFTSPISAIVGPNGSGKSNSAEAFRFVLGEQSIKSMRGKRGEDLIFNGGNTNRASVKVVFDNTKRVLGLDFDEVSLERVVHRDGVNEYYINGSSVRLKDIVELLARAHIGASGHHIISQGEADRILTARPDERREMIEDALGLKIYQYKKNESVKKLEKTQENMREVELLRREIAPHLKFLQKQVEKVEKVRELRNELRATYREYLRREEFYIQSENERIIAAKQAPLKEFHTLERELASAKERIEKSKHKDAKSEEVIHIEKKIEDIRNKKDLLSRESGKIEGEISTLDRMLEREKEKINREDTKMVYLKDVEDVVNKIEDFHPVRVVRQFFVDFLNKHKTHIDNSVVVEYEENIKKLRLEQEKIKIAIGDCIKKEFDFTQEYNRLKDEIEKEKDSNRDAEKDMFRIIARVNEIRGTLGTLQSDEVHLKGLKDNFDRELKEAYVLGGREAADYKNIEITQEPREAQEERRHALEKIKIRIEDSGVGNSDEISKEFKEVGERDTFLAKELADLVQAKASLETMIADLDARLDLEFKEGILKINIEFQKFFMLMFGGGKAALTTTDGIDINVELPRKKTKGLMMLSGGERALTSIALLFAISQVNPPPFIILDETDAALDEANSKKYGDMIESLAKYSQLILITHNRETMSRAGVLYGVTMGGDGASKLLSIQFEEAVKVAK
jgi:chromosome segregation protein